jgi:hypothetical protein
MLSLDQADSRMGTLFALEQIQAKNGLDDSIMDRAVRKLIPDEGLAGAIESLAIEINIGAAEKESRGERRGFFRRFFGR